MIRGPLEEYEEKVLWWIHVILELNREVLTSHVVGVADYILVAYICTNNVVIFSCLYISLLIASFAVEYPHSRVRTRAIHSVSLQFPRPETASSRSDSRMHPCPRGSRTA